MSWWHIKQAARTIHSGGIVAYPTEGVFGLGCDPWDIDAVFRILELKQRAPERGLIIIASHIDQVRPFVAPLSQALERKVKRTWPGPVTWLLPIGEDTPWWLCGAHYTLAVRVTAHPVAAALCETAGQALVSTSANISARRPARTARDVRRIFGSRIDYVLNAPVGGRKGPTEIRDAVTGAAVRAT